MFTFLNSSECSIRFIIYFVIFCYFYSQIIITNTTLVEILYFTRVLTLFYLPICTYIYYKHTHIYVYNIHIKIQGDFFKLLTLIVLK